MNIQDAGSNISLGHKQLINMTRVILRQPRVLLRNYSVSAVSLNQRYLLRDLTFKWLKNSTIIMSSQDTLGYMKCSRIIRLAAGKVSEDDSPHNLLASPDSHFAALMRQIDPSLYKYMTNSLY